MPTITLSLPVAATTVTAGLHSSNYAALQTLLNGGLDENNFAPGVLSGAGSPALTLPGSPSDGDKAILTDSLTAPTYNWVFQYEASISDANKWFCIGGSPAVVEVSTAEVRANAASYAALATAGPVFPIPIAGLYLVSVGAQIQATAAVVDAYMSYDIGGTGAVDADAPNMTLGAINYRGSLHKQRPKTLTAVTLTAKYKSNGSTTQFSERVISVMPLRVAG